jgi:peptide/nickel transport system ATP-binding protein
MSSPAVPDKMLLETDLTLSYSGKKILDGFRLAVAPGEVVGLAGESGSGKSSFANALLGLLKAPAVTLGGTVVYRGENVLFWSESQWQSLRGREVSLIPQSPQSALNPALSLEKQARLIWQAHTQEPWARGRDRLFSLFSGCNLPVTDEFIRRYPAEISVGQAQRVVISMAVLHGPSLLIADEITSSLDTSSRHHVLTTLKGILQATGTAMVFLSHDLTVLRAFCDSIAVLYEGRIVEHQEAQELFTSPRHVFTRRLVDLTIRPL